MALPLIAGGAVAARALLPKIVQWLSKGGAAAKPTASAIGRGAGKVGREVGSSAKAEVGRFAGRPWVRKVGRGVRDNPIATSVALGGIAPFLLGGSDDDKSGVASAGITDEEGQRIAEGGESGASGGGVDISQQFGNLIGRLPPRTTSVADNIQGTAGFRSGAENAVINRTGTDMSLLPPGSRGRMADLLNRTLGNQEMADQRRQALSSGALAAAQGAIHPRDINLSRNPLERASNTMRDIVALLTGQSTERRLQKGAQRGQLAGQQLGYDQMMQSAMEQAIAMGERGGGGVIPATKALDVFASDRERKGRDSTKTDSAGLTSGGGRVRSTTEEPNPEVFRFLEMFLQAIIEESQLDKMGLNQGLNHDAAPR